MGTWYKSPTPDPITKKPVVSPIPVPGWQPVSNEPIGKPSTPSTPSSGGTSGGVSGGRTGSPSHGGGGSSSVDVGQSTIATPTPSAEVGVQARTAVYIPSKDLGGGVRTQSGVYTSDGKFYPTNVASYIPRGYVRAVNYDVSNEGVRVYTNSGQSTAYQKVAIEPTDLKKQGYQDFKESASYYKSIGYKTPSKFESFVTENIIRFPEKAEQVVGSSFTELTRKVGLYNLPEREIYHGTPFVTILPASKGEIGGLIGKAANIGAYVNPLTGIPIMVTGGVYKTIKSKEPSEKLIGVAETALGLFWAGSSLKSASALGLIPERATISNAGKAFTTKVENIGSKVSEVISPVKTTEWGYLGRAVSEREQMQLALSKSIPITPSPTYTATRGFAVISKEVIPETIWSVKSSVVGTTKNVIRPIASRISGGYKQLTPIVSGFGESLGALGRTAEESFSPFLQPYWELKSIAKYRVPDIYAKRVVGSYKQISSVTSGMKESLGTLMRSKVVIPTPSFSFGYGGVLKRLAPVKSIVSGFGESLGALARSKVVIPTPSFSFNYGKLLSPIGGIGARSQFFLKTKIINPIKSYTSFGIAKYGYPLANKVVLPISKARKGISETFGALGRIEGVEFPFVRKIGGAYTKEIARQRYLDYWGRAISGEEIIKVSNAPTWETKVYPKVNLPKETKPPTSTEIPTYTGGEGGTYSQSQYGYGYRSNGQQLLLEPQQVFKPVVAIAQPKERFGISSYGVISVIAPSRNVQFASDLDLSKPTETQIPKSELISIQPTKFREEIISKSRGREQEIFKDLTIETQLPRFNEIQLPRERQISRIREKQIQRFRELQKTKPIERIILAPTLEITQQKKKVSSILGKVREAYNVVVFKGGKEEIIGKGLPKGRATALGVKNVLSTLRASFKLKPSGTTSMEDIQFNIPSKQFRMSKVEPGRYVQRKNLRFGVRGETKEAQMFRKIKKGKIKWF